MKYDKTTQLLNVNGTPLKEGEDLVTFGRVLIAGLLADSPDPSNPRAQISPDEKSRRFQLALRIEQAESVFELSVDEAALAKRLIGIYPPVYVGRCFEIFEKPLT
jgi:hypothetical protein